MTDQAVTFSDLAGGYDGNLLFNGVDVSIPRGQFTSIVGPNGAGKSTLLKFLVRALKPQRGLVTIEGKLSSGLTQRQLAKKVSMVAQKGTTDMEFTVRQCIEMGRYAHLGRFSSLCSEDQQAIDHAMDVTGTTQFESSLITDLSGGEAQRVLLARAIAQQADILALDEPINHLDPMHQRDIMRLLKSLSQQMGMTVICVLHALDVVQLKSDHVILMDKGRIVATGTPQQVLTASRIEEIYHVQVSPIVDAASGTTILLPCW